MDDGHQSVSMARAVITEAQSGLWFAQKLDPENPIFNTAHYLEIEGPLDLNAFCDAINQTAREAESLSLRFEETGDQVWQTLDPSFIPLARLIDLSASGSPHAEAMQAMRLDHDTPTDPEQNPLAANLVFLLGQNRYLWSLRVHHLATDGYGMVLIANRVAELYNAAISGSAAGPGFAPLQKVWEEDAAYRHSDKRKADADFWRTQMENAPEVVSLAPGRAVSAHTFHRTERLLPPSVTERLLARAQRQNLAWPDLITALTGAYIRRFSGAEEAIIGVPHMGRMGSASARVPSMVMNVLPLRLAMDEASSLDEELIKVSKSLIRSRRHGRYRSEQLRRDLGLIGGARRLYGPLVNVLPFDHPPHFNGLTTKLHVLGTGPVDDISFTFRGNAAPLLTLEVDANPDLYTESEAAAHGARLANFIAAALDADKLEDVAIATPDEVRRELEQFNATAHPIPDVSLTQLLEDAFSTWKDRKALTFDNQTLSYAELDQRTASLASALQAKGVGAENLIAIALPRSFELVIALIATLRAGAAYLPLDIEHPPERIAKILSAAQPSLILADDDPDDIFGDKLFPPSDWPIHGTRVQPELSPENAAYVIYTSGSTGDPKGVLIEHRAIVNRLLWMQAQYQIGPHTRILQKTPATFDVSAWEFFLALISGGELVVAPPGAHRDPTGISALIRKHAITDLHFVPSMLSAFLADPSAEGIEVTHVFCSGEELTPDQRNRFHRIIRGELHNLYGPTEAAVDVSYWPAAPDDTSSPVPIGWPVWNTRLLILDEKLRPVAPGMTGNLYLGGAQLARGYLGRPDLTQERFIEDPYNDGEKLYLTGDVAKRREDGAVVFLGRSDHQVKIRGLRIELGEIEAAYTASGMVREVIVIAREDRPGDKRLVAYIVPDTAYEPAILKSRLSARLPDYMIPSATLALEAMPVTSNGKLDRKALPAPVFETISGRPPATETEQKIADLFVEILGLEGSVSAEDDFFSLGGDSLLAVRLMLKVKQVFGHDPGLGSLFDNPRVSEFSALIDLGSLQADNGLGPFIRLAEGDASLPPIFVIHPAGGIAWGYRTLARAISPARTVWGLQSPALDPSTGLPESISELGALYARRILEMDTPGPIHLAGWSVGGIIAQAAAVELESRGHRVGLMAMLDSYPPECWRAEPEPSKTDALRSLLSIAGYDPEEYPELQSRDAIISFLKAGDSALGNLPEEALDGVIRVVLDTNRLVRQHHHRRFGGTTTHIRAALDHQGKPLTPELWKPYTDRLDVVEVPFLHPQLTSPAATAYIAPALSERMAATERKTA